MQKKQELIKEIIELNGQLSEQVVNDNDMTCELKLGELRTHLKAVKKVIKD